MLHFELILKRKILHLWILLNNHWFHEFLGQFMKNGRKYRKKLPLQMYSKILVTYLQNWLHKQLQSDPEKLFWLPQFDWNRMIYDQSKWPLSQCGQDHLWDWLNNFSLQCGWILGEFSLELWNSWWWLMFHLGIPKADWSFAAQRALNFKMALK